MKAGIFRVTACGAPDDIARANKLLHVKNPQDLDVHTGVER
jgi:hypothetical protein